MVRFTRKFAIVTVEKVDADRYRVTDGETEYYIDRETLERDFEELL